MAPARCVRAGMVAAVAAGCAAAAAPGGTIVPPGYTIDYDAFRARHARDAAERAAMPHKAAAQAEAAARAAAERMAYHWMAPMLSGGGYSSEALAFTMGLLATGGVQVSAEQHGDSVNMAHMHGLPPLEHQALAHMMSRAPALYRTIAVCHSEPGAWHLSAALPQRYSTSICPPASAAYRVGRTMFETDRLPDGWAARLNAMDEVWVPTAFAARVFAAGGVAQHKMVVLPEPVDTTFFDPAGVPHPPLNAFIAPRVACAVADDAADDVDDGGEDGGEGRNDDDRDDGDRNDGNDDTTSPATAAAAAAAAQRGADGRPLMGRTPECPIRFLSVGKWERRKNYEALLRAFLTAFARRDDSGAVQPPYAELYILTSAYHGTADFDAAVEDIIATRLVCANASTQVAVAVDGDGDAAAAAPPAATQPCLSRELVAARRSGAAGSTTLPRVKLLRDIPQTDMPLIYASVDAFVSPTRGEGWGRPHVEAMAMALPVIATNWSGITEFLTPAVGYPVPYTHLAAIPDGAFAGHLQAEVNVTALAAAMRHVADHPRAAARRGAAARALMVDKYSPAALAAFLTHQADRITEVVAVRSRLERAERDNAALAAQREAAAAAAAAY